MTWETRERGQWRNRGGEGERRVEGEKETDRQRQTCLYYISFQTLLVYFAAMVCAPLLGFHGWLTLYLSVLRVSVLS